MNDLYYKYSQDSVCLNSFFLNKTERKDGLQCTNKKLSLRGNIVTYTLEDLVMN